MSRFTTRVELYGDPNYETYNKLHANMETLGFSRQIIFNQVTYWLPNAEYTITSEDSIGTIKNKAINAASKVWVDFGVLVTKTEVDRDFHNLKNV